MYKLLVRNSSISQSTSVASLLLQVAAAVITVASCEAEADPGYGYYYGAYPALYNAYPNWPGNVTSVSDFGDLKVRSK